jgi:trk system potassium uptake protein TrkH
MKIRYARFRMVLTYVGSIFLLFGIVLLVPLLFSLWQGGGQPDVAFATFAIPAALSLVVGALCRWQIRREQVPVRMGTIEAMLICTFSWLAISAVGALPFCIELGVPYTDAYFEAMSGFTTTGITMLTGLDGMARSLLFWRSLTQWIGGLGILSFFMFVVFQSGHGYQLITAESHKISGPRIAPGMWNTLKMLWLVYLLITLAIAGGLVVFGSSVFDAVNHAFTCISTGGYSPYDASIAHYGQHPDLYPHYRWIEYVLLVGMCAGGMNFLVHYRVLTGNFRALWDGAEVRAWWGILAGCIALVMFDHWMSWGWSQGGLEATFRHCSFQVVSIATTTGYGTRDIGSYPALSRQLYLLLMVLGGCAGSTAGGIKIVRVVILWKLMTRQVRRALKPASGVELIMLDGTKLSREEAYRTSALFFAWMVLLLFGSAVTAVLSSYGPVESASGMFSALGNIGPAYIPVQGMTELHPIIKWVYTMGMLAGRLEIIPLLILFSRRTWE